MASQRTHSKGPWINCHDHVDDADGVMLFRNTRRFEDLNSLDFALAGAAPELLKALEASDRISLLRDELGTNYARLNDSGRTVTAESKILSRKRIKEIHDEIRSIRSQTRAAIAKTQGGR